MTPTERWRISSYRCANGVYKVQIYSLNEHGIQDENYICQVYSGLTAPTPDIMERAKLLCSVPQMMAELKKLKGEQ